MKELRTATGRYSPWVAVGLGLTLGGACVLVSPLWVTLFAAISLLAFAVLRQAEIGLLCILALTSSVVFPDSLPLIPVGIGSLHISDLLLLTLLIIVWFRRLFDTRFRPVNSPLGLPLVIVVGAMILSTLLAVNRSAIDLSDGLRSIRTVSYYLSFFVVMDLVRSKEQLHFLYGGIVIISLVVAGAMISQSTLGTSVALFPGRIETLETQGKAFGSIVRVLPPGQSLVMFGFVIAISSISRSRTGWRVMVPIALAAVIGMALLLTFNRNFWVVAGIALVFLTFFLRKGDRTRLIWRSIITIWFGLIVVGSTLILPNDHVEKLISASLARLGTLFDAKTSGEGSLQFRYAENDYAIPQIVQNPLLGLGVSVPYRPWDWRLDYINHDLRSYIHNGHLGIMLASGSIGYFAFLWLTTTFLYRGTHHLGRISDGQLRSISLASMATWIGILVANLVSPIFLQPYWTPVLGIMLATAEVAYLVSKNDVVKPMGGGRS